MSTRRLVLLAAVLAAITGCATSALDPQSKATIRSVYIEPPQLPEAPTVAPPEGGALAVAGGTAVPAGKDAAARLKTIVDSQVQLGAYISAVAARELQARGYRIASSTATADARLRFTVFHGLGVSAVTSNARGVAMTVNMELVRASDGKRLLFDIENLVDPDVREQTRHEPYATWFSNEPLTVQQYKLVAENLVAKSLRGM